MDSVILQQGLQLILSLSLLVILHELGHFIPARAFRTRVEKFYLFFDLKFALWKRTIKGTEFGIGWIPLGGYVKIAGMIDESMDKEQMQQPPQPWEFRAKPAWQRLIIMLGGVTVNLLLGLAIYAMVLFVWGRDYLPLGNETYGVMPSEVMKEQGVLPGDRILAIDGERKQTLQDIGRAILIDDARILTIDRGGKEMNVVLSTDVHEKILDRKEKVLFVPRIPFVVDSLARGGNAEKSGGFRKADRIVGINGAPAPFFSDFVEAVGELKGRTVNVEVVREGTKLLVPVEVDDNGRIGIYNQGLDKQFTLATERYTFLGSIPAGIKYGLEILGGYARSLKLVFSSSGVKQMGGFGTIGGLFGRWGDWQTFWETTAFISIVLAFMNVLPIPALDGGHVMFLLYEMVARKPAPQRVMEVAQMIGMAFILLLILYANGNDIF